MADRMLSTKFVSQTDANTMAQRAAIKIDSGRRSKGVNVPLISKDISLVVTRHL